MTTEPPAQASPAGLRRGKSAPPSTAPSTSAATCATLPAAAWPEVLTRLLTAHHAPSVGFMQPWRFIAVRSATRASSSMPVRWSASADAWASATMVFAAQGRRPARRRRGLCRGPGRWARGLCSAVAPCPRWIWPRSPAPSRTCGWRRVPRAGHGLGVHLDPPMSRTCCNCRQARAPCAAVPGAGAWLLRGAHAGKVANAGHARRRSNQWCLTMAGAAGRLAGSGLKAQSLALQQPHAWGAQNAHPSAVQCGAKAMATRSCSAASMR